MTCEEESTVKLPWMNRISQGVMKSLYIFFRLPQVGHILQFLDNLKVQGIYLDEDDGHLIREYMVSQCSSICKSHVLSYVL